MDKARLDSMLCGENAATAVPQYLREMRRVLKPAGSLCIATYGSPAARLPLFGAFPNVTTIRVPRTPLEGFKDPPSAGPPVPDCFFLYVCRF